MSHMDSVRGDTDSEACSKGAGGAVRLRTRSSRTHFDCADFGSPWPGLKPASMVVGH